MQREKEYFWQIRDTTTVSPVDSQMLRTSNLHQFICSTNTTNTGEQIIAVL